MFTSRRYFPNKNAFREIRYSVDDGSLSQKLIFRADWSKRGMPGIGPDDQVDITVPLSTEYVCVKLFYIDGSESELKKFTTADLGVSRS